MRALFLLALLCLSSHASAAFFWTLFQGGGNYPSPAAACGSFTNDNPPLPIVAVIEADPQYFRCYYVQNGTNQAMNKNGYRIGAPVCDAPKTYNQTTGVCDAPPPNVGEYCGEVNNTTGLRPIIDSTGACVPGHLADKAATCKSLALNAGTESRKVFVKFDSDGVPQAPEISSKLGCVAQLALGPEGVAHCKLPAAKSSGGITLAPAGAKCVVAVTYTGAVQQGATGTGYPVANPGAGVEGACKEGEECLAPEQPIVKDSTPCNYMYNGSVVGCESTQFEGNPGEMNCGTVGNGPYECTKKVPTSNGIKIVSEIATTDHGNGKTTEVKTDTITQTKCIGANACVTNVSNNKSTTIKGSDGKTESTQNECTGPACSSNGGGDADGDGVQDCAVKTCSSSGSGEGDGEEEEGGGPEIGPLTKPTQVGNFDDANGEWDEKIETARADLEQKAEQLGALFQPISSLNLASGDAALGCGESFEVPGGGTASICFGRYESQLSILAAAVLFICALIALFIIFWPERG